MKRILCWLLILTMTLPLFGCDGEKLTEPVVPVEDTYPEFVYGVWESEVLKSEPGNYDRSARISDGYWAETEKGYYKCSVNLLYYADKENPGNWVLLCNEPNCKHEYSEPGDPCSAYVPWGCCFYNDRIYYMDHTEERPELYTGKKSGLALYSMAMDGTDHRLEFAWEDAMLSSDGGGLSGQLSQSAMVIGTQEIQADGTRLNRLFLADAAGARQIYSWNEGASNMSRVVKFAGSFLGTDGNAALATNYIDGLSDIYTTIVWEEDGQLLTADLSGTPCCCAYFFDGNLRIFRANDGYYDIDLATMEEVKLCDAQLQNSGMRILQANCVLESNLFQQNNWSLRQAIDNTYTPLPRVGEGALLFFDGQQWYDVELPEELKNLPEEENLSTQTMTGEYIIFTVDIKNPYEQLKESEQLDFVCQRRQRGEGFHAVVF